MDWLDFAISIILTTLRGAVKNEQRKRELRAAMLKLAATIHAIWGQDDEFMILLEHKTKTERAKLTPV